MRYKSFVFVMVTDIIIKYFIYVKELKTFGSMIEPNRFLILNMCERFKMTIFLFTFICFITNFTIVILYYLYKII